MCVRRPSMCVSYPATVVVVRTTACANCFAAHACGTACKHSSDHLHSCCVLVSLSYSCSKHCSWQAESEIGCGPADCSVPAGSDTA